MGFGATVYNALFRRTSTFAITVIATTFFFERTFDLGADLLFEKINQGKLWKHIEDNYK